MRLNEHTQELVDSQRHGGNGHIATQVLKLVSAEATVQVVANVLGITILRCVGRQFMKY